MRYHSLINHCLTYITDIVGLKLSLVASMYWQTQVTVFLIFLCFIPIGIKVEQGTWKPLFGSASFVHRRYVDCIGQVLTYVQVNCHALLKQGPRQDFVAAVDNIFLQKGGGRPRGCYFLLYLKINIAVRFKSFDSHASVNQWLHLQ